MYRRRYKPINWAECGRKRKWKDMEILRIKLNPEQAVLTCCDSSNRAVTYQPGTQAAQCGVGPGCGSGPTSTSS